MFKTNFINAGPTPRMAGDSLHANTFTRALETTGDKNFGMKVNHLLMGDNQKIIDALAELGITNVNAEDLSFFYAKPPEAYLQELENSKFKKDRQVAADYREGVISSSFTYRNLYNGAMMTFIDSEQTKNLNWDCEITDPEKSVFKGVIAHELAHRLTYDMFYNIDVPGGELVSTYVSMKFLDPETLFFTGLEDAIQQYSLCRDVGYQAFQDVLNNIDPRLGDEVLRNPDENPFAVINDKLKMAKLKNENKTVKSIFMETMYNLYEKHIRGKEGAPIGLTGFLRSVITQFQGNIERMAKEVVKTRLAAPKKSNIATAALGITLP